MFRRITLLSVLLLSFPTASSLGQSINPPPRFTDEIPLPEGLKRDKVTRGMVIPLPEPPFKVDRRHLPEDRATRPRGKPYKGPIIDVQFHLNTKDFKHYSIEKLKGAVHGLREAGVELALVMPTPNEGRKEKFIYRRIRRLYFKELGGKRVKLFCCGNYLSQTLHRFYYDTFTKEKLNHLLKRLEMDLDSGLYAGVGEFALYHFDKVPRNPIIRIPPNFEPFLKVVDLIAKKGVWLLLHVETRDPRNVSYENEFFGGLELMYQRNPNLKLIVAHNATTNPDNVRAILKRYPKLMVDWKTVGKQKKYYAWRYTEPVHNPQRILFEDWAQLFEEMPERFLLGPDFKFWRKDTGFGSDKYNQTMNEYRKILGGLNPKAAGMIAYENAKKLFIDDKQ